MDNTTIITSIITTTTIITATIILVPFLPKDLIMILSIIKVSKVKVNTHHILIRLLLHFLEVHSNHSPNNLEQGILGRV